MSTPAPMDPGDREPCIRLHAGGVVPGGYNRVSEILALVPLMEQFGVKLDEVLQESGLPAGQFDDPENLIPFREASRLFGMCADRAGCPHLGVLMGKSTTLDALGLVADMARSASHVRSALQKINRYLTLSDGGGLGHLVERARLARWGYALYEPGVERAEVLYDYTLANSFGIMRELCGPNWRPHEILLMRKAPSDLQPYWDYFDAPLRFDSTRSALVFEREWLDAPLATSNPVRLAALEAQARDLEARSEGSFLALVRRTLRRQLLSGSISIVKVADELSMHPRTLERRLQEQQASFRSLVDEVRFAVAKQLLRTRLPMSAIAASLKYRNSATFSRAFRRWSGTTPRHWRRPPGFE